jgi:hypothetical protein
MLQSICQGNAFEGALPVSTEDDFVLEFVLPMTSEVTACFLPKNKVK